MPTAIESVQARLADGSLSQTNTSFLTHSIVDTVPFSDKSASSFVDRLFTAPIGQTQFGLAKTEMHTNLRNTSQLPAGQEQLVDSMSISFSMPKAVLRTLNVLSAIDNIMRNSRFRLVISPKEFEAEVYGAALCAPRAVYADAALVSPVVAGNAVTPGINHGWDTVPYMVNFGFPIALSTFAGTPINFYLEHAYTSPYGANADLDMELVTGAANHIPAADPTLRVWRHVELKGTLVRPG